MEERILNTQSIYRGRVVNLDVLDVALHNGELAKRELVRHPGAVAIVALLPNDDVLLVRQFRIAAGKVMLEIPAGTLNPNENPLACAERELQEETGYRPGAMESLGGMFVAPGYTTEYIHLFLATDLTESRLAMDDDEVIEVDRVPLAETIRMIERGDIHDGKSMTALLRVARMRGV